MKPDTEQAPPPAQETAHQQQAQAAHPARARIMGLLLLFFALAGAACFAYWHFFLRFEESTDNAYVAGNKIRISSRIEGSVSEIFVDTTDAVAAGQVLVRLDPTDALIALDRARASLADAIRQANNQMPGAPPEKQPLVMLRIQELKEAWLTLQRCEIRSPAAGHVARRTVQPGMHVTPGIPLMTVLPLREVWVEANFKEVQLARLRIGQKASVRADMYGNTVTYSGTVAGFSPGTGSSFALLPPENATGNWIKVVQRIPVRIVLDSEALEEFPLLVGLSCTVRVDVTDTSGPLLAPPRSEADQAILRTKAPEYDFAEIEAEIEKMLGASPQSSAGE